MALKFSRKKDIQKKDWDAIEAFGSYVATRVRNPAGFYKHLRKQGHTNKMAIFRANMKHQKHMKRQGERATKWYNENRKKYYKED